MRVISAPQYRAPRTGDAFGATTEYFRGLEREACSEAGMTAEAAAASLRQANPALDVTTALLDDSPKRAIVEYAETYKPDLIVVGSHGRNSWQRALLGSVSQSVALHAPCSMLIVRHHEG